jgi:hypothetical protein
MGKIALMALILFSLSFAEVPEHNPDLDYNCGEGFQWSRGTVSCKQADCPAGAGRTYTYDCNCGEAWDQPFRTCYDPERPGFAVACVPAGSPCPGEKPPPAPGSMETGGGDEGTGGNGPSAESCDYDSDCPSGYQCDKPANKCVIKEQKCNDILCFLEGGKCAGDVCVGKCENVTCDNTCTGSTFKYDGQCREFTGECEYSQKTCENGCSGSRCRMAVGKVGFRDIDNKTKPLKDIKVEAAWYDEAGSLKKKLEARYSDSDGTVDFSEDELDENGTFTVTVVFEDDFGRVLVADAAPLGAGANDAQRAALPSANYSVSRTLDEFTTDFYLNLTFTRREQGAKYGRVYFHALEAVEFMEDDLGVYQKNPPERFYVDDSSASGAYHDAGSVPGVADKGIVYSPRVSRFSDPESPTNREWHEFGHHIMYETYGYHYCCVNNNHAGYSNPTSVDSYTEGFAEFMSMMMLDYYDYPNKNLYFVGATPYNIEINYRIRQQVGGVPMEEMALASIYYDLLDGGPNDEDGIQLTREQIWGVLSTKHQLDGQQRYIHSMWDAYRAFNATDLPGIHEKWGNVPFFVSRWDRIFITHGVYADPDSSNSWTPGEEVGYTLIGGVGRAAGAEGGQFNRPEVPGSYIRLQVTDEQTGAPVDYYPVHVSAHVEGYEEGEPVSYDFEFDTVPDENGELNINMPPEEYETTMRFSAGGDEDYERKEDVFEITSEEYYEDLDPETHILKTYPVSLKPKPIVFTDGGSDSLSGGFCCAGMIIPLVLLESVIFSRRKVC